MRAYDVNEEESAILQAFRDRSRSRPGQDVVLGKHELSCLLNHTSSAHIEAGIASLVLREALQLKDMQGARAALSYDPVKSPTGRLPKDEYCLTIRRTSVL